MGDWSGMRKLKRNISTGKPNRGRGENHSSTKGIIKI